MNATLRLSGLQHEALHEHLFPGDGLEAVAIVLCGRRADAANHTLTAWKIVPIPHDDCIERSVGSVSWETRLIDDALEEAADLGLGVVKIHSHPGGYRTFSKFDDDSDSRLFPSIYVLADSGAPHASAVMLPDGEMFGRIVSDDGEFEPLSQIQIAGEDIRIWGGEGNTPQVPGRMKRQAQAFGDLTMGRLGALTVAVVGCSGLGCPTIQQLLLNGVRRFVLVDPDRIELLNLNRIVWATPEDAEVGNLKVDVMKREIERWCPDVEVVTFATSLADPIAARAVAGADIAFGCMDGTGGRHLLSRLTATYLIPYFDLGVRLVADGQGGVSHICGTVNYLQPDLSSLLSRGVYTMADVQADDLHRADPEEYARRKKDGYIAGVAVERPAVASINNLVASLGVLELLARLHPYRDEPNSEYAAYCASLTHGLLEHLPESRERCMTATRNAGRGDMVPLLGMPVLSERRAAP